MTTLEMNYSNDRTAYVNDANHYDGRNGYHQHTGTYYNDGRATWQYNASNDHYDYYNHYYKGEK